jgi:hypothetical protein
VSLYDLTTDLHHRAETHPVGTAMSSGSISAEAWADWLCALDVVHEALDPLLDPALGRLDVIREDIEAHGVPGHVPPAARRLAEAVTPDTAPGIGYIFAGAHLRGGAVLRRRLPWPCAHLTFKDARAADRAVRALRGTVSAADDARMTFRAILDVFDDLRS